MREIKFRAWDKESGRMFSIARFDFADHTVYSHLFACEGYLAENLKIMQYTGLKDKNGREIYEGDIVKYPHIVSAKSNWEVSFRGGSFVIKQKYLGISLHELAHKNNLEVIGNIYENPELFEVKK